MCQGPVSVSPLQGFTGYVPSSIWSDLVQLVLMYMYPPPFGVIRYTCSLCTTYDIGSLMEQSESSLRVHINMLMH